MSAYRIRRWMRMESYLIALEVFPIIVGGLFLMRALQTAPAPNQAPPQEEPRSRSSPGPAPAPADVERGEAERLAAAEVMTSWDVLRNRNAGANVGTIIESGARVLAPLFERVGIPASGALALGRTFFEHLASSVGDEVSKRAVDAAFDFFSSSGRPPVEPARNAPATSVRTLSVSRATVRFDLDRAVMPPSGQAAVNGLLGEVPPRNALWMLVASTDRSGPEARNTKLAGDRGNAVAEYLVKHDVDTRSIIRKNLPELAAPVPGYDGGLDPENRKAEVFLLSMR